MPPLPKVRGRELLQRLRQVIERPADEIGTDRLGEAGPDLHVRQPQRPGDADVDDLPAVDNAQARAIVTGVEEVSELHRELYSVPRRACSRSMASNSALKFPFPKLREPCRSMTSKKSVGRSSTGLVKICSR